MTSETEQDKSSSRVDTIKRKTLELLAELWQSLRTFWKYCLLWAAAAWSAARQRYLAWRLSQAKIQLAEAMLVADVGDESTRKLIDDLDKEIATAKGEKRPTKQLRKDRESHLLTLLKQTPDTLPPAVVDAKQRVERYEDEIAQAREADVERPGLLPYSSSEWKHLGVGTLAAVVGSVLVLVPLSFLASSRDEVGDSDADASHSQPSTRIEGPIPATTRIDEAASSESSTVTGSATEMPVYLNRWSGFLDSAIAGIKRKPNSVPASGIYVLADIADLTAELGDTTAIEQTIDLAEELSRRHGVDDLLLSDLKASQATCLARRGKVDAAVKTLSQIESGALARARAYGKLSTVFAELGNRTHVEEMLDRMRQIAKEVDDWRTRVEVLALVGRFQASAGIDVDATDDIDSACADAQRAGASQSQLAATRGSALSEIAFGYSQAGNISEARRLISVMEEKRVGTDTARMNAALVCSDGLDFQGAFQLASGVQNDFLGARSLQLILGRQLDLHPLYSDSVDQLMDLGARKITAFESNLPLFEDLRCLAMINCAKRRLNQVVRDYLDSAAPPKFKARVLAAMVQAEGDGSDFKHQWSLAKRALVEAHKISSIDDKRATVEAVGESLGRVRMDPIVYAGKLDGGFEEACFLVGMARGERAIDGLNAAYAGGLVYRGATDQPSKDLTDLRYLENPLWKAFYREASGDEGDMVHDSLRNKNNKQVVAFRTRDGFDIAYSSTRDGVLGCVDFMCRGYFKMDEQLSLGKLVDERPPGAVERRGRFIFRKRLAVRPTGWIIISVQPSKNG